MTGTLFGYPVSILIDTGATECFIDPKIAAMICVRDGFMAKCWTVEYGNRDEHRAEQCLFCSELELPSFQTKVNLYVAPLGSYDVILGINLLSEHKDLVKCQDKVIECLDDIGHSMVSKNHLN